MTSDRDELLTVLEADFDDVDLAMFDGDDPPPCEPPADVDQANRYLATLRHLQLRMTEIEQIANAEAARVDTWRRRQSGRLLRRYEWVERALDAWARAVNAADPHRKTISLPNGDLRVRPRPLRVEVTADQETLARLRKEHPGWVREKLEPEKRELLAGVTPGDVADDAPPFDGFEVHSAFVSETGELLPGVFVLVPTEKAVKVTLAGPWS